MELEMQTVQVEAVDGGCAQARVMLFAVAERSRSGIKGFTTSVQIKMSLSGQDPFKNSSDGSWLELQSDESTNHSMLDNLSRHSQRGNRYEHRLTCYTESPEIVHTLLLRIV